MDDTTHELPGGGDETAEALAAELAQKPAALGELILRAGRSPARYAFCAEIGGWLCEQRSQRTLSRAGLARQAGIDTWHLHLLEYGLLPRDEVDLDRVRRLAAELGEDPEPILVEAEEAERAAQEERPSSVAWTARFGEAVAYLERLAERWTLTPLGRESAVRGGGAQAADAPGVRLEPDRDRITLPPGSGAPGGEVSLVAESRSGAERRALVSAALDETGGAELALPEATQVPEGWVVRVFVASDPESN